MDENIDSGSEEMNEREEEIPMRDSDDDDDYS